MAARIAAALELPARSDRADPKNVDADDDSDRRQQLREQGQCAVRVGCGAADPGAPPQKRSGASDQTPTRASSSTTFSSSVSIAR